MPGKGVECLVVVIVSIEDGMTELADVTHLLPPRCWPPVRDVRPSYRASDGRLLRGSSDVGCTLPSRQSMSGVVLSASGDTV